MKAKIKKTAGKAKKQNFLLIIERIYLTGGNSSWYDIRKRKIYYKVISKSIIRVSHMCWEHGGEALQNLMGKRRVFFRLELHFWWWVSKKFVGFTLPQLPPPLLWEMLIMVAQNEKKKWGLFFFFFSFLNASWPKTHPTNQHI